MTLRDFWLAVTLGCIAWYVTVMLFAAWRGCKEVLHLVRVLRDRPETDH